MYAFNEPAIQSTVNGNPEASSVPAVPNPAANTVVQEPAQLSGNQPIPENTNYSQAPPQDQSGVQIEEVVEETGDQAEAKPESLSKKKKYLAEKLSCVQCSCGFNKMDEEDSIVSKFIAWLKALGDKINALFERLGAWFSKTFDSTSSGIGGCLGKSFLYILQTLYCVYSVYPLSFDFNDQTDLHNSNYRKETRSIHFLLHKHSIRRYSKMDESILGIGTCFAGCLEEEKVRKSWFFTLGYFQVLLTPVYIGYFWALYTAIGALVLSI